MELIILVAANVILGLFNLVLTIINIHNTEKEIYDLIDQMTYLEMNELTKELYDYFKGE